MIHKILFNRPQLEQNQFDAGKTRLMLVPSNICDYLLVIFYDTFDITNVFTGLILGLHPANERRRYKVTASLIGWAQT